MVRPSAMPFRCIFFAILVRGIAPCDREWCIRCNKADNPGRAEAEGVVVVNLQRRVQIATLSAVVCAVLALAACQMPRESGQAVPEAAQASDHIPADFNTTFRWIPNDTLDLSAPEGTFVRAFVESFEIANAAQSTSWGYPGFAAAAPSNIAQMLTVYPSKVSEAKPSVGTVFFSALRREDHPFGTRVILCRYAYSSVRDGEGTSAWNSRVDAPRPIEIDFRRQSDTPPIKARGSERTPDGNVFGGWYASRYDFAAVYPTPTADQRACAAQGPTSVPNRAATRGAHPWAPMPPSPGWSAGNDV